MSIERAPIRNGVRVFVNYDERDVSAILSDFVAAPKMIISSFDSDALSAWLSYQYDDVSAAFVHSLSGCFKPRELSDSFDDGYEGYGIAPCTCPRCLITPAPFCLREFEDWDARCAASIDGFLDVSKPSCLGIAGLPRYTDVVRLWYSAERVVHIDLATSPNFCALLTSCYYASPGAEITIILYKGIAWGPLQRVIRLFGDSFNPSDSTRPSQYLSPVNFSSVKT